MTWLEKTPWWLLATIAIALALAPFGDSHLVQKSRMLFGGTLRRPLDWFDLMFHATPLLLLIAKVILILRKR